MCLLIALSDFVGRKLAMVTGAVLYGVGGALQTAAYFLWLVVLTSCHSCNHYDTTCVLLFYAWIFQQPQDGYLGKNHCWNWHWVSEQILNMLWYTIAICIA